MSKVLESALVYDALYKEGMTYEEISDFIKSVDSEADILKEVSKKVNGTRLNDTTMTRREEEAALTGKKADEPNAFFDFFAEVGGKLKKTFTGERLNNSMSRIISLNSKFNDFYKSTSTKIGLFRVATNI